MNAVIDGLRQPENGRLGLGLTGLGFVGAFGFQAAFRFIFNVSTV
ncbi:hypothetical protein [Kingella oralis]|nr:hypothetical protein [Kingella oralis]